MKKLESTFLNMTVVLTCITLIAAAGTAAVFNFTQKPIADAKQAKQEAAIKVVMPGASLIDLLIINAYSALMMQIITS